MGGYIDTVLNSYVLCFQFATCTVTQLSAQSLCVINKEHWLQTMSFFLHIVAPSKSTTRREQARLARQRRLEATVAEYRRLVALEEEEDTQSSGATSSTVTTASSSVTKPAGPSRAKKDDRHRQATEIPAAPHRSCKDRQRRLRVRMSNLEQEVLRYKTLVKGLRSELATLRKEYDAHAASCTSTSTLQ